MFEPATAAAHTYYISITYPHIYCMSVANGDLHITANSNGLVLQSPNNLYCSYGLHYEQSYDNMIA